MQPADAPEGVTCEVLSRRDGLEYLRRRQVPREMVDVELVPAIPSSG